jgi:hypothetical protein
MQRLSSVQRSPSASGGAAAAREARWLRQLHHRMIIRTLRAAVRHPAPVGRRCAGGLPALPPLRVDPWPPLSRPAPSSPRTFSSASESARLRPPRPPPGRATSPWPSALAAPPAQPHSARQPPAPSAFILKPIIGPSPAGPAPQAGPNVTVRARDAPGPCFELGDGPFLSAWQPRRACQALQQLSPKAGFGAVPRCLRRC